MAIVMFAFSSLLPVKIPIWKFWPWKFRSRSRSITFTFATVFEIFTFQNFWLWKCRSRTWSTTFAVTPFDGQYPISYLMALSLAVHEIFANQKQTLTLKTKVRSWSRKTELAPFDWKCSKPYNGRFFFRILATWQLTYVYAKGYTNTAKDRGDDYRQNL